MRLASASSTIPGILGEGALAGRRGMYDVQVGMREGGKDTGERMAASTSPSFQDSDHSNGARSKSHPSPTDRQQTQIACPLSANSHKRLFFFAIFFSLPPHFLFLLWAECCVPRQRLGTTCAWHSPTPTHGSDSNGLSLFLSHLLPISIHLSPSRPTPPGQIFARMQKQPHPPSYLFVVHP